jgi:hypothetical protein
MHHHLGRYHGSVGPMNGVNQRLGRKRGPITSSGKVKRERLVQLANYPGLKGTLARSILSEDDELEHAYTDGEHSK